MLKMLVLHWVVLCLVRPISKKIDIGQDAAGNYICLLCQNPNPVNTSWQVRCHIRAWHEHMRFKCHICPTLMIRRGHLKAHLAKKHNLDEVSASLVVKNARPLYPNILPHTPQ